MSIEAIAAIGSATAPVATAPDAVSPSAPAFESLLNTLNALNTQMLSNQQAVADLALGRTDNLHQVMMNMEQTRLGFELMLAVRNKTLEAYQELMRMQV